MTDPRRQMAQELAHLTRRLGERGTPTPLTGDEGDRAVANHAIELQHAVRDRDVARVVALRAALARMDDGRYGFCDLCDKPIASRRLEVMPATPWCVECAGSLERDAARGRSHGRPIDEEEDEP